MTNGVQDLRKRIGRVGAWLPPLVVLRPTSPAAVGSTLEGLGYGSLWVGGGVTEAKHLNPLEEALSGTSHLVVATGILNIWAWRPPVLARTVSEIADNFDGRFVLGIGVSHAPLVAQLGLAYEHPLEVMKAFLADIDESDSSSRRSLRVLAALGPRMLELAALHADGAHPYLVPVEHTARARQVLGPAPLLVPELAVVLDDDPFEARRQARQYMSIYLTLANYLNNLRRLGFGEDDLSNGASDRLVDAIVAWGTVDAVRERVKQHLDAGADHVAVQPVGDMDRLEALRVLAPVLGDL